MDNRLVLALRLGIAPFTEELAPPPPERPLPARGDEPSAAWIRGALDLVLAQQRAARSDRVWPILREVEPLLAAREASDPAIAGRITGALATQALLEGAFESFLDRAARAADLLERAGDAEHAAERASLGAGLRVLGLWDEAIGALRAAIAGGAGRGVAASARLDLGRVLAARGAIEEAEEAMRAAIAGLDPSRDRALLGLARACLAELLAARGAGAEIAESAAIEARAAMEALTATRSGRARAGAALSRALLAAGRIDEARAAAERAREDLDACAATIDDGEALVLITLADARLAAGDPDGAARASAEARRRVLAHASRLRDPRARRAFLESIPAHRRALGAA